jgi:hypothetical protein
MSFCNKVNDKILRADGENASPYLLVSRDMPGGDRDVIWPSPPLRHRSDDRRLRSSCQTILVPPTAPIVTFKPGSVSDVAAGDNILVVATKHPTRITRHLIAPCAGGVRPLVVRVTR